MDSKGNECLAEFANFPPHIYMFNATSIDNDISYRLLSEWLPCAAYIAHWIVHVT